MVSGGQAAEMHAVVTGENNGKREGNVDIFYRLEPTAQETVMTQQFTGGSMGGAIEVRDHVVTDLMDRTDHMAHTLANSVNEAHRMGINRLGQTGVDFFKTPENTRDASVKIALSDAVKKDGNQIVAGMNPMAPADNRVALVIANLQHHPILENGTTSLDDYYAGMVGKLGVMVKKANDISEHQHDVLEQLKNVRESISGVNLDEEAIKMIEYQKHFDASAKMIKVADQLFDTILGILR
jgi:flagellar hook-associated protein 1 FlgK